MSHPAITEAFVEQLRRDRREAHERLLALIADLSDAQLARRHGDHAPSIGFHLWHVARWNDFDRAKIDGSPQIWHQLNLALSWGFGSVGLGEEDTGTEMGDQASDRLVLPGKMALLDYARAAFDAIDTLLDRMSTESLLGKAPDLPGHDGDHVLSIFTSDLVHDNRHLGMIEALRGLLDLNGTATR